MGDRSRGRSSPGSSWERGGDHLGWKEVRRVIMKPVFQTITSGELSNCLQASIASILEKPINEVPNFNEFSDDKWESEMFDWFKSQGYGIIFCYEPGFSRARSRNIGYHLITVKSPRGEFLHSLVGFNGIPIHDPFPGGNCEHNGIVSFEFLIPLGFSEEK